MDFVCVCGIFTLALYNGNGTLNKHQEISLMFTKLRVTGTD